MQAQRQTHTAEAPSLDRFLVQLTELSRQHGVAIADMPHVYLMEKDDYAFSYACDDDGRLTLR